MKIFVAGATGAIGRLLVPLLVTDGHEVAGTTRSAAKREQIAAAGANPVVADALDRDAMFAALRAERPDVVIHQLTDLSGRDYAATHGCASRARATWSMPHWRSASDG